ncbi:MAG: ABC transporter substrate-binding protein [Anaerolineales bacterium]|nr:ABC transporter substrate-binding protein [Anaerolineales bacterium]MCW5854892.1 ABC transporter substrate-binding protein [Anaerolineales bacterium]
MTPERVVSLVPSITESLFDLGLGSSVVGITGYCIHPAEALRGVPRLGGTKNPRINEIIALRPDLIFANQEENTAAAVHALQAAGLRVLVHFPLTVHQAIADLEGIATLYADAEASARVVELAERLAAAQAGHAPLQPLRLFCPIWQDADGAVPWWMTFNQETFTHDILRLCGFVNVFAQRGRRYPLAADLGLAPAKPAADRDTRYPRVTREEILAAQPEVILLPSEPYEYTSAHLSMFREAFAGTPAADGGRIVALDGSLLTWPGTRLAKALDYLSTLHASLL